MTSIAILYNLQYCRCKGKNVLIIALLTLNEPLLPRRYVRVDSYLDSKTSANTLLKGSFL